MNTRPVRDCECPRRGHKHGTMAAYKRDACRCWPCTEAHRRATKQADHRRATGQSKYTDAEPVRVHLQQLLDAGLTIYVIEQRSRINRTGLRHILHGKGDKPPAARVHKTTASAILAVDARPVGTETRGMVDPTGALRRLHALVAIGWPEQWLSTRLGMWRGNYDGVFDGGPITVHTRTKVAALYDQLWDQTPPATTPTERAAVTRARNRARTLGWAPPLAWDDDTIDDPEAKPQCGATVTWGVTVEDVTFLIETGETLVAIAHRLGLTVDSIYSALGRHHRQDLIQRLKKAA